MDSWNPPVQVKLCFTMYSKTTNTTVLLCCFAIIMNMQIYRLAKNTRFHSMFIAIKIIEFYIGV